MTSTTNELQLGVLGFFPTTHTRKQMKKMCPWSLHTVRCFTRVYLHAQTTVHNAPDESRLLWSRENPKYPQLEPHAGIKMAQVLGSQVCIFIPAWGSSWGVWVFPAIKIILIHQVLYVLWSEHEDKHVWNTALCAKIMDAFYFICFHVCVGRQKPQYPYLELHGCRRHYMGSQVCICELASPCTWSCCLEILNLL